jgi:hypothetical protein
MAQEDIVKMARKAGIAKYGLGWTCWEGQLEAFAALVAEHERNACAKVCEELVIEVVGNSALAIDQCARSIRARKEK